MRTMTTSVLFWLLMALGLCTTLGYSEHNSQAGMLHGSAETIKAVSWLRGSYLISGAERSGHVQYGQDSEERDRDLSPRQRATSIQSPNESDQGLLQRVESMVDQAQIRETIHLAALDNPEGPPPCGRDNFCNLAVCPNDPDCPADMPEINRTPPSDTQQHNEGGIVGVRFGLRSDSLGSKVAISVHPMEIPATSRLVGACSRIGTTNGKSVGRNMGMHLQMPVMRTKRFGSSKTIFT